jgi:hypothetical protein
MSKPALLAAALVLSLPLAGALPALAEDAASPAPDLGFTLTIPTIQATGSSMTEEQIRDALTGNFLAHVDELANLSAASITIPEITITTDATVSGEHRSSTATYTNLVLSGVKSGIAETTSIDRIETSTSDGTFTYNRMVQNGLDIPGIFSLVGLIPASSTDFRPLTNSFSIEGASFTGPEVSCTIGPWNGEGMEAKPVTVLLKDVMAAGTQIEASNDNPPASALKTVVTYILDILTSFRTHPTEVGGFDCKGSSPEGAGEVAVGKITVGGFEPGVYPSITVENVKVDAGDKGTVSIGKAELKPIDLNPPIDTLRADIDNLSSGWFDRNARKLIPSVAGLDLAGITIDVADPEQPGARIQASLDDFDISLSDYVNGLPSKVSVSTHGLDVPLDAASNDDDVKMLLALGITRVNLDASFSVAWDKATSTIKVDKVSIAGKDLGSFAVAAVLGNAAEQLFDTDPKVEQAAAMGLTVKSITLDAVDAGLADKLYPLLAQQEGISDPAAYRSQMAGMAEGAALQMLGSTDAARQLGAAVGDFITGKARTLTINIAAKDPAGIAVPMLMQAGDDPTVLASALDITGSNPAQ